MEDATRDAIVITILIGVVTFLVFAVGCAAGSMSTANDWRRRVRAVESGGAEWVYDGPRIDIRWKIPKGGE